MINGHGDDLYKYDGKVKINFSTNIYQGVDHSQLMRHLSSVHHLLSNYPEPEPSSVELLLAEMHAIKKENVFVTNGATESIYLIARMCQGKSSSIVVPTFREYQDACRMFHHSIDFISEKEFNSKVFSEKKSNLIWLCNPNNPTGKVFPKSEILSIVDSRPDTLFIIDQAYADYSVKEVLSCKDIVSRSNIIMLQSLTKQFSVPGLRIGYLIAPGNIITSLKTLRIPWSVNSFAIEAAHYLLKHNDQYHIDKDLLHPEAKRIATELGESGIYVYPTDCNFILCKLPFGSAASLKEWLIDNYGILIRDASNFESLDESYFRVAAQSPSENDLLINGIKQWMLK